MKINFRVFLASFLFSATIYAVEQSLPTAVVPGPEQNLKLKAPITSWDEAVPLGNGLLGGLLWGEGSTIRLSLDRGDLWDERPATEKEWWKKRNFRAGRDLVARKDFGTLDGWWDGPYNGVTPTKLPAGRLEIALDPSQKVFELRVEPGRGRRDCSVERRQAIGSVFQRDGTGGHVANRRPGAEIDYARSLRRETASGRRRSQQRRRGESSWAIPRRFTAAKVRAMVRAGVRRGTEILRVRRDKAGGRRNFGSHHHDFDERWRRHAGLGEKTLCCGPGRRLRRRVQAARCLVAKFWGKSSVTIPAEDLAISRQYYLVQYFYGAALARCGGADAVARCVDGRQVDCRRGRVTPKLSASSQPLPGAARSLLHRLAG